MIVLSCPKCGSLDLKNYFACTECNREWMLYEVKFVLISKTDLKKRLFNDGDSNERKDTDVV